MLAALLPGCTSITRLDPPPAQAAEALPVLGIPNARFWLDAEPGPLLAEARLAGERSAALVPRGTRPPPLRFLALSGGGDSGAFGAGLLIGWTEAGDRPSFDVVTGISAGALIAPFAFLGPAYDAGLREVFTGVAPTDILLFRQVVLALLFNEALADTSPLYRLIERHADERMLAAIAAEYRKGRLLFIGTTNLDLQRPVAWNIGAIAASGQPGALTLFRRILLASASIPGAFPPVLVDVELDGRVFQEMHVDGGVSTTVFLWPPSIGARDVARLRGSTAYVIRNGRMDVERDVTTRGLFSIARRSAATLIHFSGVAAVYQLYLTALRDEVRFRLAYVGPEFQAERREPFDTQFMRALFDHAHAQARAGYPWADRPPRTITTETAAPRAR